ncbi:C-type lectin 37Db-like [Drosophila gunungcola]|uniref:C-type lectin 37Db-like n=1 Tax=Drosophila gunungcola TaxID=103775 RepID=UPI0022DF256C|nr:C-type lectin 37Db-like [Drosophila gunungcola]
MAASSNTLFFLCGIFTFSLAFAQLKVKCPSGFTLVGEKCYRVSYENANWFNADRKCYSLNSTLVVFDDRKDMQLLTATLEVLGIPFANSWKDSIWTGLTSLGMGSAFVQNRDGSSVAYTPWSANQPQNLSGKDCVAYADYNGFGYHNIECSLYEFPFVCQAKRVATESYLCLKKQQFLEVDVVV